MRQLLLRVPDELHARLAARAARDGTSVNQLATTILGAAVDADGGSLRDQVRARAAAQGALEAMPQAASPVSVAARRKALRGMAGIGPVLDDALRDERGRLDRLRRLVDPRPRLPPR
jgi:plasmid stability protein